MVEDWRELIHKNALDDFKKFMLSIIVFHRDEKELLKESLISEQREIEGRRRELMDSISELKPPSTSTEQIYSWSEAMDNLYKELGRL